MARLIITEYVEPSTNNFGDADVALKTLFTHKEAETARMILLDFPLLPTLGRM